ncbi:hypothetical protein ABZ313_24270 [Streptomyces sp. NPDC006251]|uniref:hypothetical protein n=1 Tax=Streptomyces sp. NPDC006251 TaxID=3155718 RepID=UPI0033AF244E
MSRRAWISAALVLTMEVALYVAYARYGVQFHFWLHGLFGGALGLAALTIVRIVPRYGPGRASPWESGFLGHLYSALPDLLFVGFGVLHVLWMDVFAFHIPLLCQRSVGPLANRRWPHQSDHRGRVSGCWPHGPTCALPTLVEPIPTDDHGA